MNTPTHRQRGAALVVGLLLLLILTLLAISGMNTATTELVMAGNSQYQARAFQAAETGIERVVIAGNFNPAVVSAPLNQTFPDGDPDTIDDAFQSVTQPRGTTLPPPGYSIGAFTAEHFVIVSRGTSSRNASATHTQGIFVVAPAAP